MKFQNNSRRNSVIVLNPLVDYTDPLERSFANQKSWQYSDLIYISDEDVWHKNGNLNNASNCSKSLRNFPRGSSSNNRESSYQSCLSGLQFK